MLSSERNNPSLFRVKTGQGFQLAVATRASYYYLKQIHTILIKGSLFENCTVVVVVDIITVLVPEQVDLFRFSGNLIEDCSFHLFPKLQRTRVRC